MDEFEGSQGAASIGVDDPGVKFAQMEVALGKGAPIEIELPSRLCVRLRDATVVGDLVKFVREVGAC